MSNLSTKLKEPRTLTEYVACFIEIISDDISKLVGYGDVVEDHEFVRKEGDKFVVSFSFLGLEYEAEDLVHAVELLNKTIDTALTDTTFQNLIDGSVDEWSEKKMWKDSTYGFEWSGIPFLDSIEQIRIHRHHNVREWGRAIADDIANMESDAPDVTVTQFVERKGIRYVVSLYPTDLQRNCRNLKQVIIALKEAGDMCRADSLFQSCLEETFNALLASKPAKSPNMVANLKVVK